jgi:hypothetical protein
MSEIRFKAAFLAMTPDADPKKYRDVLSTSLYELTSILVKNEDEAVEVSKELAKHDGVQSFILCPGFTNRGVARLAEAVGDSISVNVARGDGPSNAIAHKIMSEAGFFDRC